VTSHPFHERCLAFSASILCLVRELRRDPTLRSIADQLIRSGTSVGANTQEARSAESKADFIHKVQIALKEARETGYWLALIEKTGFLKNPLLQTLRQECHEITAMLVAAVRTAGKRQ
jgi:four helix bundle protein